MKARKKKRTCRSSIIVYDVSLVSIRCERKVGHKPPHRGRGRTWLRGRGLV